MPDRFSRTGALMGEENMEKLKKSKVAVFGIGGVGGFAAEALVRSGIGRIDLIDNDTVSSSNINRQIFALSSTVGMMKTKVAKDRFLDINPELEVNTFDLFFMPDTPFDFSVYDYIVDAVDTVSAKIEIIVRATENNIPVISSMGAGNKINPAMFEVADIYKTSVCPLAKVMRYELKKRGIKKLKCVYSKEPPITPETLDETGVKKRIPGSNAFTPSCAGLIIASEVVKDLTGMKN